MKIAIVVHGRFHGFDLAKALSDRHHVTVFTNYPKWAACRFGLRKNQVRSFWVHGLTVRMARTLGLEWHESLLHKAFSRWAAARLVDEHWDAVHVFSGVAEEVFAVLKARTTALRLLVRGSSHIRTQARILADEEVRTGCHVDHPSPWIIAREEAEYALADRIVVLSSFARESFISEGESPSRICVLPLGASVEEFRPGEDVIEERCRRILSGEPLRVLYVGNVSFQKGFWDMAKIMRTLPSERFRFRVVGEVHREVRWLKKQLHNQAEFIPRQPQNLLLEHYSWADVFIFPTLQDGFAVVLAQAAMAGLPILTTTNCTGKDLVRDGETGFIHPIRKPEAFIEHLKWSEANRGQLAMMSRRMYTEFRPRSWSQVAADFEHIVRSGIETRTQKAVAAHS